MLDWWNIGFATQSVFRFIANLKNLLLFKLETVRPDIPLVDGVLILYP